MEYRELKTLVIVGTLIFLIGPVFIFLYVSTYFKKRKRHMEEKLEMRRSFDAELSRAQMEVREQTMETIGADLHDNVGQLLSLSALTLNAVQPDSIPKGEMEKILSAVALTKNALEEMRLLGKLLQGEQLVSFGLQEAMGYELEYLRKLGVYHLIFEVDPQLRGLVDSDRELIVFRILQESISNIIKHAEASEIAIQLASRDDLFVLSISDNGKGFNRELPTIAGMGLLNIKKRAEMIGAAIEIKSAVEKGTTIQLKVPYGTD